MEVFLTISRSLVYLNLLYAVMCAFVYLFKNYVKNCKTIFIKHFDRGQELNISGYIGFLKLCMSVYDCVYAYIIMDYMIKSKTMKMYLHILKYLKEGETA